MPIKFYADNDFNGKIVNGLRDRGLDIIKAYEDNTSRLKDPALLSRSTELQRVLLTHDKHFFKITANMQKKRNYFHGVIFVPQVLPIGDAIRDIELIAVVCDEAELLNMLKYIPLK